MVLLLPRPAASPMPLLPVPPPRLETPPGAEVQRVEQTPQPVLVMGQPEPEEQPSLQEPVH